MCMYVKDTHNIIIIMNSTGISVLHTDYILLLRITSKNYC